MYPGAEETANGVDDDCDGVADEGTEAYDDDGDGWSEDEGDCDDDDASVYPGTVGCGGDTGGDDDPGAGGDTGSDAPVAVEGEKDEIDCGCAAGGATSGAAWALPLALLGLARRRRG